MVVLAVILLLLVTIVALSAILAGDGPASLNLVGADIVTTERVLFFTGAVSAATAAFALWLLFKGLKRARARRVEMQRLRAAATAPVASREVGGSPDPPTRSHGTPPTAYPATMRRPDDDERDHFESLPRE